MSTMSHLRHSQIACGTSHTLVLTDSADTFAFGSNRSGQLGICAWFPIRKDNNNNDALLKDQLAPHAIDQGTRFDPSESLKQQVPVSVACGAMHSVLLTEDGEVFVWGSEQNGRLGLGECFVGTARDQAFTLAAAGMDYESNSQQTYSASSSSKRSIRNGFGIIGRRASERSEQTSGEGGGEYIDRNKNYNVGGKSTHETFHSSSGTHISTSVAPFPIKLRAFKENNMSIKSIACGADHTLCIDSSGNVWTFGIGSFGALGHGDSDDRWLPQVVQALKGLNTVVAVGGAKHSACVTQNGHLYTFGHGDNGRLGNGVQRGATTPELVDALRDRHIVSAACGESHTGAISEAGELFMWGAGAYGKLGHGEESDVYVPKIVVQLAKTPIHALALGVFHSLAVTRDGGLYTWGGGQYGKLGLGSTANHLLPTLCSGIPAKVSQVAAGSSHSCCVVSDGSIYAFGSVSHGRLGGVRPTNKSHSACLIPQPVAGKLSGMAITGKVRSWNIPRELSGAGPFDIASVSTASGSAISRHYQPPSPTTSVSDSINSPSSHSHTQQDTHSHMEWQRPLSPSKQPVSRGKTVCLISCGAQHSVASTIGGNMFSWGGNEHGQLGCGSKRPHDTPVAVAFNISSHPAVVDVSCGAYFTLCCMENGDAFAWGCGSASQLGTGTLLDEVAPSLVQALQGRRVVQVEAGEDHGAAITSDGVLYTWGSANMGKCGHGRTAVVTAPTSHEIGGLNPSSAVARSDGTVTADNLVSIPQAVGGQLENRVVKQVSLGMSHSACVTEDGRLYTFGSGWYGRLGIGSTENMYVPQLVTGIDSKVVQVSCGSYHTVAVTHDGLVYVWGRGDHRLGLGNVKDITVPNIVLALRSSGVFAMRVSAGEDHTMVLSRDGAVWTWGQDSYGKLGILTSSLSSIAFENSGESDGSINGSIAGSSGNVMNLPNVVAAVSAPEKVDPALLPLGQPSELLSSSEENVDIRNVCCFLNHSLALGQDGTVYAWGCTGTGRLGIGNPGDELGVPRPCAIPAFAATADSADSHGIRLRGLQTPNAVSHVGGFTRGSPSSHNILSSCSVGIGSLSSTGANKNVSSPPASIRNSGNENHQDSQIGTGGHRNSQVGISSLFLSSALGSRIRGGKEGEEEKEKEGEEEEEEKESLTVVTTSVEDDRHAIVASVLSRLDFETASNREQASIALSLYEEHGVAPPVWVVQAMLKNEPVICRKETLCRVISQVRELEAQVLSSLVKMYQFESRVNALDQMIQLVITSTLRRLGQIPSSDSAYQSTNGTGSGSIVGKLTYVPNFGISMVAGATAAVARVFRGGGVSGLGGNNERQLVGFSNHLLAKLPVFEYICTMLLANPTYVDKLYHLWADPHSHNVNNNVGSFGPQVSSSVNWRSLVQELVFSLYKLEDEHSSHLYIKLCELALQNNLGEFMKTNNSSSTEACTEFTKIRMPAGSFSMFVNQFCAQSRMTQWLADHLRESLVDVLRGHMASFHGNQLDLDTDPVHVTKCLYPRRAIPGEARANQGQRGRLPSATRLEHMRRECMKDPKVNLEVQSRLRRLRDVVLGLFGTISRSISNLPMEFQWLCEMLHRQLGAGFFAPVETLERTVATFLFDTLFRRAIETPHRRGILPRMFGELTAIQSSNLLQISKLLRRIMIGEEYLDVEFWKRPHNALIQQQRTSVLSIAKALILPRKQLNVELLTDVYREYLRTPQDTLTLPIPERALRFLRFALSDPSSSLVVGEQDPLLPLIRGPGGLISSQSDELRASYFPAEVQDDRPRIKKENNKNNKYNLQSMNEINVVIRARFLELDSALDEDLSEDMAVAAAADGDGTNLLKAQLVLDVSSQVPLPKWMASHSTCAFGTMSPSLFSCSDTSLEMIRDRIVKLPNFSSTAAADREGLSQMFRAHLQQLTNEGMFEEAIKTQVAIVRLDDMALASQELDIILGGYIRNLVVRGDVATELEDERQSLVTLQGQIATFENHLVGREMALNGYLDTLKTGKARDADYRQLSKLAKTAGGYTRASLSRPDLVRHLHQRGIIGGGGLRAKGWMWGNASKRRKRRRQRVLSAHANTNNTVNKNNSCGTLGTGFQGSFGMFALSVLKKRGVVVSFDASLISSCAVEVGDEEDEDKQSQYDTNLSYDGDKQGMANENKGAKKKEMKTYLYRLKRADRQNRAVYKHISVAVALVQAGMMTVTVLFDSHLVLHSFALQLKELFALQRQLIVEYTPKDFAPLIFSVSKLRELVENMQVELVVI